MDKQAFNHAKNSFPLEQEMLAFQAVEEERKKFISFFTLDKIAKMAIDEYAEGKGIREHNFCYGLERTLKMLGNIEGSTSKKFGVYYDKKKQKYEFVKRFGSNYIEAFNKIKESILDLLDDGNIQHLTGIKKNPLAPTFKGKILSVYYPELYLNIFSEDHVDHYLKAFDLYEDSLSKVDVVFKRRVLVDFKNNDPVMQSWPMNMFAVFLWKYFPKPPQTKAYKWSPKAKDQLQSDESSVRKGNFGYGGEGKQHKKLKEYIYNNPGIIGIDSYKERGIEHNLLSGDRLDVWFKLYDGSEIAVEVKSRNSSSSDILRGLFQCVKYQSILKAENKVHDESHTNRVVLVLGGNLSKSNANVRDILGVEVFEKIKD